MKSRMLNGPENSTSYWAASCAAGSLSEAGAAAPGSHGMALRKARARASRARPAGSAAPGWWKGAVTLGEFLMGEVLTGKQPPHEIRRHLNLGGRR